MSDFIVIINIVLIVILIIGVSMQSARLNQLEAGFAGNAAEIATLIGTKSDETLRARVDKLSLDTTTVLDDLQTQVTQVGATSSTIPLMHDKISNILVQDNDALRRLAKVSINVTQLQEQVNALAKNQANCPLPGAIPRISSVPASAPASRMVSTSAPSIAGSPSVLRAPVGAR